MDERQFMKVAAEAMSDETILPVNISIMQAWMLVSGLQLATRHPGIGAPLREHLVGIARQFQEAIEQQHPGAHEALEMGWKQQFDVKRDRPFSKNSRRHQQ
jgi:hypothetical protein